MAIAALRRRRYLRRLGELRQQFGLDVLSVDLGEDSRGDGEGQQLSTTRLFLRRQGGLNGGTTGHLEIEIDENISAETDVGPDRLQQSGARQARLLSRCPWRPGQPAREIWLALGEEGGHRSVMIGAGEQAVGRSASWAASAPPSEPNGSPPLAAAASTGNGAQVAMEARSGRRRARRFGGMEFGDGEAMGETPSPASIRQPYLRPRRAGETADRQHTLISPTPD